MSCQKAQNKFNTLSTMTNQEALYIYLLRLGDNALLNGHRLAEWCSRGPF